MISTGRAGAPAGLETWKYHLHADGGDVAPEELLPTGASSEGVTIYGEGNLRTEELYKEGELFLKVFYDGDHAAAGRGLRGREPWSAREKLPVKASLVLLRGLPLLPRAGAGSGNASSLLSVLGIAVGVMTLTVVLAVMNGFQLGFIESIVEISSYHLQLQPVPTGARGGRPARHCRQSLALVSARCAVRDRRGHGARSLRRAAGADRGRFPAAARVRRPRGTADLFQPWTRPRPGCWPCGTVPSTLGEPQALVLGSELAAAIGRARRGCRIPESPTLAAPADGRSPAAIRSSRHAGSSAPGTTISTPGSLFMSLPTADALYGGGPQPATDMGGEDRQPLRRRARPARTSRPWSGGRGTPSESWRAYNRSFFDALFVEKLMMMLLVGLIFVVVGFNVYHSLRRSVHERMEEIAVLKAVGVPPRRIRSIFILEGLFIGLAGGAAGLLLGLVAVDERQRASSPASRRSVNGVMLTGRTLALSSPRRGGVTAFSIFSPTLLLPDERALPRVLRRRPFSSAFFAVASLRRGRVGRLARRVTFPSRRGAPL